MHLVGFIIRTNRQVCFSLWRIMMSGWLVCMVLPVFTCCVPTFMCWLCWFWYMVVRYTLSNFTPLSLYVVLCGWAHTNVIVCYHLHAEYLHLYTWHKPRSYGMSCCSCSVVTNYIAHVILFAKPNVLHFYISTFRSVCVCVCVCVQCLICLFSAVLWLRPFT